MSIVLRECRGASSGDPRRKHRQQNRRGGILFHKRVRNSIDSALQTKGCHFTLIALLKRPKLNDIFLRELGDRCCSENEAAVHGG
jgi:hypothetical protein